MLAGRTQCQVQCQQYLNCSWPEFEDSLAGESPNSETHRVYVLFRVIFHNIWQNITIDLTIICFVLFCELFLNISQHFQLTLEIFSKTFHKLWCKKVSWYIRNISSNVARNLTQVSDISWLCLFIHNSLAASSGHSPEQPLRWQHCCPCQLWPVPRRAPLWSQRTAPSRRGRWCYDSLAFQFDSLPGWGAWSARNTE